MSNVLKVSEQETIRGLYERGWSLRRIAGELGLNRRTVSRYAAKCTRQVTTGSGAKCTGEVTAGSGDGETGKPVGKGRAKSLCAELSAEIGEKVGKGLSAQRIYQDLVSEHGFGASYQSVKRFVAKLKAREPKRVWRIESQPGEEAQVDFGLGAMIVDEEGRRRRSWVLRVVLGYSRKGYSEAVMRQDTESFLRCLENAFRHFGGSPAVLNLDNLKAGVIKADWYDPEINPKLADFCRHYGVNVMPCRPATPQHKGKVERGVGYVRNNALKGPRFESVGAENRHLAHWETHVADTRIHGTTCKQVAALFEEERTHLQPLPGVGKSHIAQAIGAEAIKAGFLVLYRSVFDLVRELLAEETESGVARMLGRYLKPDLLIIDDMGLKTLPPKSGEILLEIIMRRYENRSTLMTSNRPIEEWGKLLCDVPAASAILDRLLHHAEVIPITGRSYRLQQSAQERSCASEDPLPQNPRKKINAA